MLSPLSWWNEQFVNLPLALAFAWLVSWFDPRAFTGALVLGYWLTNIVGFTFLHKGPEQILAGNSCPYSRRDLLRDLGISLLYTALIVALVKLGVLQPMQGYSQTP
jgi:hypothetical protein